jgi:predicted AAA+ superfamily ATPase
VSLNEIAAAVKLDVKTVGKYIDILEKAFVIKRLTGFSKNLRKEITTKNKYFFYDNGIRNAVISQFNKLENRDDVGFVFENFAIMERIKTNSYKNRHCNSYFWRTYDGQEVDYLEEREGMLLGYEFKWSDKRRKSAPRDWAGYENSEYKIINKDNYLDFIL